MARYFKFRTVNELASECSRLGLALAFRSDLSPLFEPQQIGRMVAGNRFCIQPMEGCDCTLEGKPDELTFRRYERFGSGGAKLIWGEAVAVCPEGRANPRQLLLNDANAAAIELMLEQCRSAHREAFGSDADLVVGLQLTHSGRYSFQRPLLAFRDPLLDPRTPIDRATGRVVDASYPLLSDDELQRIEDSYVAAARLAWKIGFDFVDVKQCHRYLLNELLAARTRPGPYGGSFENRTRLARSILIRIRDQVPDLSLASRLSVFDGIPFQKRQGTEEGEPCSWVPPVQSAWGVRSDDPLQPDLSEPLRWIAEMSSLGVSMVNISMGNPYASPHIVRPFEYPPPDGYQTPEHPLTGVARHFTLTGEVQRAFPHLPVVGSGYSYLQGFWPQAAAANVAAKRASLIGVGRASLSQPDFVRQLMTEGRLDPRRTCRTFSYCTALMRAKHNPLGQFATGCPPFDKDVYGPLWAEARADL